MIAAAVVRAGAAQRAGADAHHHRRVHLAVAHVAQLRRLQHDLPGGLEHEIGEHQVGDRARAGRRGADRGAGEALLGDRRVDHARAAELLPEVLGVREGAAALAGALAEIEDVRIRGASPRRCRRAPRRASLVVTVGAGGCAAQSRRAD